MLGLSEGKQLAAQAGLGFEECAEEGEGLGSATSSDVWQLGVGLAANGELCLHRGPLGRCLRVLARKWCTRSPFHQSKANRSPNLG